MRCHVGQLSLLLVLHLHLPSMPPPCAVSQFHFFLLLPNSVARRLIPKDCILISLVDWLTLKFSQWKCWPEIRRCKEREVRVIFSLMLTCLGRDIQHQGHPPSGPFFIILALSGVKELYLLLELLILGVYIFLLTLVYGCLSVLSPYVYTHR